MGKKPGGQARKSARLRKRRQLLGGCAFLFFLAAMVFAVSIYVRQDKEIRRLAREQRQLQQVLAAALAEADEINELRAMSGSKEFIERIARDELGLVRPDEIIFSN